MSRIKLNELNNNSLEVLDNNAASEVVGGFFDIQTNLARIDDNDVLVNLQFAGGIASGGNGATNTINSTNTIAQLNV